MKKSMSLTLLGVLVTVGTLVAANDPKDEKAITETMEAMAKATISKDVGTLNRIYGDTLMYSHSSGMTQSKAVVLKAFQGANINESMTFSDSSIRIYGDVALFKGICDFRNGPPGAVADNHLNILWVLVKNSQGPFGWQIVSRQTTRIDETATGRAGAPPVRSATSTPK